MYGIPGFEQKGQEPVAFDPLSEADAIEIAATQYDLVVQQATRLETERDDTFRLDAAGGTFVLKVAHPADPLAALELQTQAIDFAGRADAALPLPRVLPSRDGDFAPALPRHRGRRARLLTWLPGAPLRETTPTEEQRGELGRVLGRVTDALDGFDHPAAHRPLAWDLAQFPALAGVAREVGTASTAAVFDRFEAGIAPHLADLPHQVVHNDLNPGNVLVEPEGARYVTGIIDFGDCIYTARVCDLAIALSYQLFPLGRSWNEVGPVIDAYRMVVPLEQLELDLLPDLVAVRFAQRLLIHRWMDRGTPEAHDFGTQGVLAALDSLLETA